jgi:hypothetical protein
MRNFYAGAFLSLVLASSGFSQTTSTTILVQCFVNGNQYRISDASTIEVPDLYARCPAD